MIIPGARLVPAFPSPSCLWEWKSWQLSSDLWMRTNGGACSCIRLFQAVTLSGNFGPAPGRATRVGLADTASELRWSPLTALKFMKLGGFRLRFSRLRGGRRMAAAATTPHLMSHIHKHLVLAYLHGYLPFLNYGCRYFVLKDKAHLLKCKDLKPTAVSEKSIWRPACLLWSARRVFIWPRIGNNSREGAE